MKKALIALLLLTVPVSCVRELTLDPGEEPMVVVDCVLCDGSPQTLRLFLSQPPAYSEMVPITDAEVELFDKTDGKSVGLFAYKEGKEWSLDYTAVPRHGYRLEVRVPGHDLVYAEDTMPALPEAEVKRWDVSTNVLGLSSIQLHEDCKFGAGFIGMAYRVLSPLRNVWIYAMVYDQETGKRVIVDEICTDHPCADNFNLTGDSYVPGLFRTTLGVYSSFSFETELYPQLKGAAVHRRYLRLDSPDPDADAAREWFLISGDFEGNFLSSPLYEPWPDQGYLVFASFSDNYDLYIRDALRIGSLQASSDISTIYNRDNIPSNVVGGLGIFGAQVRTRLPWTRGWDYETVVFPEISL